MTWIETVGAESAHGPLVDLYDQVAGADGQVDRILQAHSLRPHTLIGHMALYKNVLHHTANRLPKFVLEALGIYVSLINGCEYCVAHHAEGLRRLVGDRTRAGRMIASLESGTPESAFEPAHCALLAYARKLTEDPAAMVEKDVRALREQGVSDGEILEANQVIAYFAYANRTVLGLGVTTDGEALGQSPSADDSSDWRHR